MRKKLVSLAALAVAICGSVPAFAQSGGPSGVEGRVSRLESEMRAVQRKVFPGGAGQYVEPQIQPQATTGPDGLPASSPVADLNTRVNTLEGRLSSLTGEIETTEHRVQVLENDFAAYKRATDARLKALEGAGPAVSTPPDGDVAPPRSTPPRDTPPPAKPAPSKAPQPTKTITKADPVTPPTTDPVRQKKIAAIEHPQTDDAGEDAYIYGYRLWQAKLYPEAEAQFKTVTTTYPKHKRASYAQNLLGRSYLDDGKPSLASLAFYDNYKKWPDGERAPESLYYLAQALVKLGKPAADVCKVYRELNDVYGAKVGDAMKADIAKGRAASKCS